MPDKCDAVDIDSTPKRRFIVRTSPDFVVIRHDYAPIRQSKDREERRARKLAHRARQQADEQARQEHIEQMMAESKAQFEEQFTWDERKMILMASGWCRL